MTYEKLKIVDDRLEVGPNASAEATQASILYESGMESHWCITRFKQDGVLPDLNTVLDSLEVKYNTEKLQRAGKAPVCFGPHALFFSGIVTITTSDEAATALGLWTPRTGAQLDSSAIEPYRLT